MKETTAVLLAKGKDQATFLTGLPAADTADMSDVEFLSRCYAKYFETVLANEHDGLGLLNYTNINAGNFPTIVRSGLHYPAQEEDMAPMLEQFNFHSKDDSNTAKFKADSAEKQDSISDSDKKLIEIHCAGFVDRLDASPYNVFK